MLKKFIVNFFISAGTNMLVVVSSAAISVVLGRYLGPDSYGQYATALAVGAIIATITNLALSKLILREVLNDSEKSRKALGSLVYSKSILLSAGIIITVFITLFRVIFPEVNIPKYIFWASLAAIVGGISDFIRTTMWSRDRVGLSNFLRIIEQTLLLSIVVVLTISEENLRSIIIGILIAYVGATIITIVFWLKWLKPPLYDNQTKHFAIKFLIQALPIGAWLFFTSLYFRIDILILTATRSSAEVGWFSISYTLIQLITSLALIFTNLVMPILSRIPKLHDSFINLYKRATKVLLIFGFIIGYWVCSIGPKLVVFVYGSAFIESGPSLRLFSFAIPVLFWVQILTTTLLVLYGQKFLIRIALLNLIVNIVLDIALIPNFGLLGATLATTVTEAFGLILHFIYLRKLSTRLTVQKKVIYLTIIGFIILAIIYLFPEHTILFSLIGTILFLVYIFFSKLLSSSDIVLIKSMFQSKI